MSTKFNLRGKMTITVNSCRQLKNTELMGKMDPYVVINISGNKDEKFKTKVVKAGHENPVFDQAYIFNLDGKEDLLHANVWNSRTLGDDHIGRLDLSLDALDLSTKPRWYPLRDRDNFSKSTGEISLSIKFEGSGLPEGSMSYNTFKESQVATATPSPVTAAVSPAPAPAAVSPQPIAQPVRAPAPVAQPAVASPQYQQQPMQQQPMYAQAPQQPMQPQQPMYQQQPMQQQPMMMQQQPVMQQPMMMQQQPMMMQQQPVQYQQPMMQQPVYQQPMMQQPMQQPGVVYAQPQMAYQPAPQVVYQQQAPAVAYPGQRIIGYFANGQPRYG